MDRYFFCKCICAISFILTFFSMAFIFVYIDEYEFYYYDTEIIANATLNKMIISNNTCCDCIDDKKTKFGCPQYKCYSCYSVNYLFDTDYNKTCDLLQRANIPYTYYAYETDIFEKMKEKSYTVYLIGKNKICSLVSKNERKSIKSFIFLFFFVLFLIITMISCAFSCKISGKNIVFPQK